MDLNYQSNEELTGGPLKEAITAVEDLLNASKDFSLNEYLEQTAHVDLSEGERLRRLGIALESDVYPGLDTQAHWHMLESVYRAAIEKEPECMEHYESLVVSANQILQGMKFKDEPQEFWGEVMRVVEEVLTTIEQQEPSSNAYYSWGLYHYFHDKNLNKAKQKLQQSLDLNPEHYMARLYLGHCYFDEQEWLPALKAFSQITQEQLADDWGQRWRYGVLIELSAVCHLHLHNQEEFERYTQSFLDLCEDQNYVDVEEPVFLLKATEERGFTEIHTRLKKAEQQIEDAWLNDL